MNNKTILVLAIAVTALVVLTGCPPKPDPLPQVIPVDTPFVYLDDFIDGDNRTDTTNFGGYWYTFDDLAASTDNVTCGDSNIWPMSENANIKYGYAVTPTFVISSYAAASETPPDSTVTSGYYARVSGTVDRSASGYPYGFVGFGANLLDVAADNFKNTINASAAGYVRLQFWYKNGPSLGAGAVIPWKVKLANSYSFGACSMAEVDDQPVKIFTSKAEWQKFDVALTDFAPEGWGTTIPCGIRGALTGCVPGAVSYYLYNGNNAQYKCNAAQALTALNAIQWQTNFNTSTSNNAFDLMIAQVALTK